jgi:nucleotide-binding universal stress UspA family protein
MEPLRTPIGMRNRDYLVKREKKVMQTKILIALDESENAMKAVEHVAEVLGKKVLITLYHVLPKAPPKKIEKERILVGHHLVFKDSVENFRAWIEHRRAMMTKVMEKAKRTLIKAGISQKNIKVKIEEGKRGVARDILKEVKDGKYDTVVVGRRGVSATKAFFAGSVSGKIFHHARNCAVWVQE